MWRRMHERNRTELRMLMRRRESWSRTLKRIKKQAVPVCCGGKQMLLIFYRGDGLCQYKCESCGWMVRRFEAVSA